MIKKYCVEYKARLWVDAELEEDAIIKANSITDKIDALDFDYPNVERV